MLQLIVLLSLVVVCAGFKVSPTKFHAKSSLFAGVSSCGEPISTRETVLQPVSTLSKAVTFAAFPALLSVLNVPTAAKAEANYPDWNEVRKEIVEIIRTKPDKGPTLVRLAWHSSGTYSKITKDGGSQKGTIRFAEELKHGANAGLDLAVSWMEPVYKKYSTRAGTDLSYADLYTFAGVVAIKEMGGPDIKWRAGRLDSFDEKDVTPDGRLPDADKGNPTKTAQGLRDVFGRMGFNDQEIVALSGAHALGRCHVLASGYSGPWTPTPRIFNNLYFKLLKDLKWTPNPDAAKFQYQDPSGKLMMLPSDLVLIEDAQFKPYVDAYAKDQKKFFADFSAAFQKLEELGTTGLVDV